MTPPMATAGMLVLGAVATAVGEVTADYVGTITQVSAFGLVAWIVYYMFTKWLPSIQAAHAAQMAEQRDGHVIAMQALAESHTTAIRTVADAAALATNNMTKAFTESLTQQRVDLVALIKLSHEA